MFPNFFKTKAEQLKHKKFVDENKIIGRKRKLLQKIMWNKKQKGRLNMYINASNFFEFK